MLAPLFAALLCVTALAGPAHADLMSFSFSGSWQAGNVTDLGVLHAGDAFSGTLTWDTTDTTNACPGSAAYSICRPLLSLTLNLPAGAGLSVAGLPDSKVNFAGALYASGDPTHFLNFQINDRSSVDNQFYIFGFYLTSGGAFGGAYVSDAGFTQYLQVRDYSPGGPSPVPEPATSLLLATGAGLLALRRRSRRSP